MRVQKLTIQYLLNPICKFMAKWSKWQDGLFYGGTIGIFMIYLLRQIGYLRGRYFFVYAIGCLFLGCMILGVLPERMEPKKISPILAVAWFGSGFFMLLSAFLYNLDYLSDALTFLVAMPVLWLVWAQGDITHVFHMLCQTAKWMFVVVAFLGAWLVPLTINKYTGLFLNTNGAAEYYTITACCLLAQLFACPKRVSSKVLNVVLLGICGALLFYTNSRTGMISALLAAVLGAVLYLLSKRKSAWKTFATIVISVTAAVAVCIPTTIYLVQGIGAVRTAVESVLPKDTSASTEDDSDNEFISGIEGFKEINDIKKDSTGKTLDDISTGRVSIWLGLIKQVRLFGTDGTASVYVPERHCSYSTAHNMILEYAVRCGLFAGLFYAAFNILAGLKSIQIVFKKKDQPYVLLPFMITIAFGVTSMLSACNVPFFYILTMFYFMVQAAVVWDDTKTPARA